MNELTQRGIAAMKSGDRAAARQLLTAAIKQDAGDIQAWLWLTGALDKDEERIACLQQVLKLDPSNQVAARGLAQIMERRAGQQAQSAQLAETPPPTRQEEPKPASPAPVIATPVAVEPSPALTPPTEAAAAVGPSPAAASSVPEAPPAPRRRARASNDAGERPIFRSRPSLVPALACFWLFLIGAFIVAVLLNDLPEVGLLFAAGLGLLLELIVLYAIIRIMTTRYELTSQQLTLRFRGKRATVPVTDIYHAEMSQSITQRMLGIGNIEIDASIDGELAHLQMHNISQCQQRTEQILYLVRDNATT